MLVVDAAAVEAMSNRFREAAKGDNFAGLLVDFDQQAGKPKLNLGISGTWLGEVVGVEADVAPTSRCAPPTSATCRWCSSPTRCSRT